MAECKPPTDPAEAAEIDRLIREYTPIAKKRAREAAKDFPHLREDFESATLEAVWKAAKTRETFRNNFASLVHIQCNYAISNVLEAEAKRQEGCPTELNNDLDNHVADGASVTAGCLAELQEMMRTKLPDERRRQIERVYLDGEAIHIVAADRGVSQQVLTEQMQEDIAFLRGWAAEMRVGTSEEN